MANGKRPPDYNGQPRDSMGRFANGSQTGPKQQNFLGHRDNVFPETNVVGILPPGDVRPKDNSSSMMDWSR